MTQRINKAGIIILTLILTIVMSFPSILFTPKTAHAATNITETNKLLGAGSDGKKFKNKYFDGGLREITLRKNGKASRLVYCMNANKHLDQYTNNSYSSGDAGKKMWNDLSKSAKKYIPLVCMFGYKSGQGEYKTKCDTGKKIGNRADFIAATQVLIWEFEAGARTSPTKRKSKSFYNDTLKGHSNIGTARFMVSKTMLL